MLFLVGVADSVILRVPEHPGQFWIEPIRYKTKLMVIWLSNGIFDLLLLVDDEAKRINRLDNGNRFGPSGEVQIRSLRLSVSTAYPYLLVLHHLCRRFRSDGIHSPRKTRGIQGLL